MKLYSDHTITLDYAPAQDILTSTLQVVRDYDADEIRNAFNVIVATVNEYHVTRLLLDFTRNTLELKETEYKQSIAKLAEGLKHTSLEKLARIGTQSPVREQKIATMYTGIKNKVGTQIDFLNFSDIAKATRWLAEV